MAGVGDTSAQEPARRLPGLDGLRGLAIVAVVVYHLRPQWLPGGFLGVDLFFVISGFLITTLLLTGARTGAVGIGGFYLRRARRILPATVLVVACLVLLAVLTPDLVRLEAGDALAGLGFATNWWQIIEGRDYFAAMAAPSSLQHLWSLAIEEQFYLLWPALITVAVRAGSIAASASERGADRPHSSHSALATHREWRVTYRWVIGVALAGAVASSAWMAWLAVSSDVPYSTGPSRIYYGTDTHASGILIGAATAALFLRWRAAAASDRPRWWVQAPVELVTLAALGTLVLITLRVGEYDPLLYRGGFLAVALLGVAAVAGASRPWSVLGRVLDQQPLRWIGVISFELYLWHWPVGLAWPVLLPEAGPWWDIAQVALMVALAGATHHWVTVPIWHPRPARRTWPGVSVLTATAAGVIALALTVPLTGPATGGTVALPVASVKPLSDDPSSESPPELGLRELGEAALLTPISAFGDSVMLGATGAMRSKMPRISVLATVSASPGLIHDRVREAHSDGSLAPIVIIHSGANGVIRDGDLAQLVTELDDRVLVVLVTIKLPRTLQQTNNEIIHAAAQGRHNTVVVDWAAASADHGNWFGPDSIHLTRSGAAAFTDLIADAITTFRRA